MALNHNILNKIYEKTNPNVWTIKTDTGLGYSNGYICYQQALKSRGLKLLHNHLNLTMIHSWGYITNKYLINKDKEHTASNRFLETIYNKILSGNIEYFIDLSEDDIHLLYTELDEKFIKFINNLNPNEKNIFNYHNQLGLPSMLWGQGLMIEKLKIYED